MNQLFTVALGFALVCAGCGYPGSLGANASLLVDGDYGVDLGYGDGGDGGDGGLDLGPDGPPLDAGPDLRLDAGPDMQPDSGMDMGPDMSRDMASDMQPDMPSDMNPDMRDGGRDMAGDMGRDATTDMGPDMPDMCAALGCRQDTDCEQVWTGGGTCVGADDPTSSYCACSDESLPNEDTNFCCTIVNSKGNCCDEEEEFGYCVCSGLQVDSDANGCSCYGDINLVTNDDEEGLCRCFDPNAHVDSFTGHCVCNSGFVTFLDPTSGVLKCL